MSNGSASPSPICYRQFLRPCVCVCVCVCKNFAELRRGMRIVEAVVLTAVVIVQCNLKSILFKLFDFFSSTILDSHACKSVEYLLKLLSTRRPTNLHCIRDIITRRRNSLFGRVVIDSTTTRQAIAHCHRSPVMLVLVVGLECLVLVLEDQVLVNYITAGRGNANWLLPSRLAPANRSSTQLVASSNRRRHTFWHFAPSGPGLAVVDTPGLGWRNGPLPTSMRSDDDDEDDESSESTVKIRKSI